MTMQSLRFPKDEWSKEDANKWIDEHKQDLKKSFLVVESDIQSQLDEIKSTLKNLADGKAQEVEAEEIKRKKELLQAVARGTSQALEAIKKL